ncbi:Asp-tRNA(Asn)/Glu-tRNA(Gln) amidotransferase GatCAB subunit A [Candidatus Saccharibacteria bacterium CG11_big_fil_rev_8_21_14_0_20_41_19]|nr:Asp-tRNA(Asn)/Glu-tRNA(Gln) amidotransferase subunit GatA [Candidatus Saccharibacteria bacterium]PIQ71158.1 MAG: Asp-tRNA(Asn)/Glu-tRNA(Gln) amidotransferase GatCAB subunit A [Candidatus Saccharibacteria bacterium CG11_big_fil_rev_8_21_14_0_20_41_19]PIZ60497.1 MAG: Asp-tRNA(Asn)/Glu-tRNA(Gln) amidotransferase GatCAB subunit A [Candidatus Saccharibacteria bacterium CG_4_10_14_0_2_um_filter_41_11]PJC29569.1 MAG: Asp-tRNA(Asn)/Glu-tRNA(Gln) amidotransferase GatCAB subunit A [Candidatus Saccharib
MTISDIIAQIDSTSAREVIETALAKARESSDYHALLNLTAERALERADAVDAGKITGKLAGVPFVIKDNFLAFGAPTTAASKMLENFVAPLQATSVEKLEAEGAICIGKSNLDAFAHGGSTENSAFGPTSNAYDKTRVSGGSSGGSAVVTALDIVPFALGSDTGGSIRQPASFNGVVGVKPTYGTISRYGVVAMASSTDVIGAFTNNVSDAELVISIMAGRDVRDMTTLPNFFEPLAETKPGLKIGLISDFMAEGVDSDVRARVNEYVAKLRENGHIVEDVSLPMAEYALAIYYILVPAELSSNLARYDGIRYGFRAEGVKTLAELYGRTRDQGFVTENKRRIMIGSYVLSSGFFDAYYLQAQKARTLLINQFNKLFKKYDMLIGPVAPTTAFKIGKNSSDPIKMYLGDIMTVPTSLAGLPAISVPAGHDESGLPVGVQLMGPMRSDAKLLALARSMESKL